MSKSKTVSSSFLKARPIEDDQLSDENQLIAKFEFAFQFLILSFLAASQQTIWINELMATDCMRALI